MNQPTNIIKVLPENLANKIAAGEVVERPASVVKELVENSIDADSKKISVFIEQGGRKLIQVVDNGSGMNAEDLKMAFERHATSKIKTEADLSDIQTLGFRGEALPSIASVSQIEAKSRMESENMGNQYVLDGGKDGKLTKIAANSGTSISVKNLFYNTPARRQFLKAESSENQQILIILKRFFLAYPDINFEMWIDGKQIFNLRECEINERVREVFGDLHFKGMLPLSASLGGLSLHGFIGKPDIARRSRGYQYLFLNGRPIQDRSLNHAVFQSYGNLIGPGEYPLYCLFLELDNALVDVNVHPTKMEVRFTNERSLYYFFINSIQQVLGKESVIPQMSIEPGGSVVQNTMLQRENQSTEIINELKNRRRSMSRFSGAQLSLTYFRPEDNQKELQSEIPENPILPMPAVQPVPESMDKHFWQLHDRYIISEIKSGMVIIDQHVAHERILYERISKIMKEDKRSVGQKLLFPQKMNLNYEDFMVFRDIHEVLNKIGFNIKVYSGNTIVIDAMPADVKIGRESQILLDIIDYYRNEPLKDFNHFEKVMAAYACKNAIKSGEPLSQLEMQNLVDQLFACEAPFFCPHGRPVIVTIDLNELDRKFKRIT